MKKSICVSFLLALLSSASLFAQHTYNGNGFWTDAGNWDQGVVPPDNQQTFINGTCEITENIGPANTFNPSRITIGDGAVGVLNVTGGTLSGAHGGNNGVIVGQGAGGDGTLIIAEGAALRSQGATMVVRIGDDFGGIGRVTVAGELLNFKFLEIINGRLEMMPTGINNKFNSADPSFIGANGTLAYFIDGSEVGALERSNGTGLVMSIDPSATLEINLSGDFALNDTWTLMSYSSLTGQFAEGTNFVSAQGYTFAVDYGAGFNSTVTLTLISDEDRPVVSAFTADPPSAASGAAVQLQWDAENFELLSIDQGVGDVTAQGEQGAVTVNPTETTTYTITADLDGVEVSSSVTVVVDELPEIASFTATPAVIGDGESSTLAWEVSGATTVTISDGVGAVSGQGSQDVTPAATTTYTLTATNGTGSVMAEATVTVDAIAAALIHQYLAEAPGQTSGALLDGVGSSNFDVRNGDLRAVVGSDHTTFTQEIGRANLAAEDGGDNGDGYPDGRTFELWIKTGTLGAEPQVVFDTGTPANGLAVLVDQTLIRVIQSNGGIRNGDVEVATALVNADEDFIQVVATQDPDGGSLGLFVRGAAGGIGSATGSGGGALDGRASLFSWSGFAGGVAGALGGLGDGEVPAGITTYQGSMALLNVYGRVLTEVEIEDAFNRWAINVPTGDVDNDMLPDFWEQLFFGNLDMSKDDDGDGDGLTNLEELEAGTDPTEADTDMDGLTDLEEVMEGGTGTDPRKADTDGDLLTDAEEVNGNPSSDPTLADTDGDTHTDSVEIAEGSDPNNAASLPDSFIGVAPLFTNQSVGTSAALSNLFPDTDIQDVTFRLCVDFEEKIDGERELIFETGGGGFGFSLVYEAGNQLVLRAAGTAMLAVVTHTLNTAQVAGGHVELVWTYDVDDEDAPGNSTIGLFVDGVDVGSDTLPLGGDWSGTNNAGFGISGSGVAGIDGGGDLTAIDFVSGSFDLRKGLQFYTGVLFESTPAELAITAVSYDDVAKQVTITWNSVAGRDYLVMMSTDLTGWEEIDDPSADDVTTTRSFGFDSDVTPRLYLRIEEIN